MHKVKRLNIFKDYFDIIEKPMCMKTIKENLQTNKYNDAEECMEDFSQMFKNCYTYNKVIANLKKKLKKKTYLQT